jgi:hypothetical protein
LGAKAWFAARPARAVAHYGANGAETVCGWQAMRCFTPRAKSICRGKCGLTPR